MELDPCRCETVRGLPIGGDQLMQRVRATGSPAPARSADRSWSRTGPSWSGWSPRRRTSIGRSVDGVLDGVAGVFDILACAPQGIASGQRGRAGY